MRSLVGLVPLFAVLVLDRQETKEKLPDFYKRTSWFIKNRQDLSSKVIFLFTLFDFFCLNVKLFHLLSKWSMRTADSAVKIL